MLLGVRFPTHKPINEAVALVFCGIKPSMGQKFWLEPSNKGQTINIQLKENGIVPE